MSHKREYNAYPEVVGYICVISSRAYYDLDASIKLRHSVLLPSGEWEVHFDTATYRFLRREENELESLSDVIIRLAKNPKSQKYRK